MKSYKQYCGVAKALDVVGSRWTLLLVRDLLLGPRRFTDLLLPGLTPNMLSTRLKQMADDGLIEPVILPPPAARKAWQLTELGRDLQPVILALGAFGGRIMGPPAPDDTMKTRWLMVSLMRRHPGGDKTLLHLTVDDLPYTLSINEHGLTSTDGHSGVAHATLSGQRMAVARLLVRGDRSYDGLTVTGDPKALAVLVDGLYAALEQPVGSNAPR